jgi:hypothetical protein
VGNDGSPGLAKRSEAGKREEDGFVTALTAALTHELPLVNAADLVADEVEKVCARISLAGVPFEHRRILRPSETSHVLTVAGDQSLLK